MTESSYDNNTVAQIALYLDEHTGVYNVGLLGEPAAYIIIYSVSIVL